MIHSKIKFIKQSMYPALHITFFLKKSCPWHEAEPTTILVQIIKNYFLISWYEKIHFFSEKTKKKIKQFNQRYNFVQNNQ